MGAAVARALVRAALIVALLSCIAGSAPPSAAQPESERILAAALARVNASVWRAAATAAIPAPDHPFIFYHQRKAGGMTVRQMLYEVSARLGLLSRMWIACYGNVSCETYDPPQSPSVPLVAILGGHLYQPSVAKYLYWSANGNRATMAPAAPAFDCLTIVREPVARVASCWNYRFSQGSDICLRQPILKYL